jgi:hypothetical protein
MEAALKFGPKGQFSLTGVGNSDDERSARGSGQEVAGGYLAYSCRGSAAYSTRNDAKQPFGPGAKPGILL